MTITEKIRKLIKNKNETFASLERKAGIANGQIASWEKSSPKLSSLEAVAKALEIPITDLLKDD